MSKRCTTDSSNKLKWAPLCAASAEHSPASRLQPFTLLVFTAYGLSPPAPPTALTKRAQKTTAPPPRNTAGQQVSVYSRVGAALHHRQLKVGGAQHQVAGCIQVDALAHPLEAPLRCEMQGGEQPVSGCVAAQAIEPAPFKYGRVTEQHSRPSAHHRTGTQPAIGPSSGRRQSHLGNPCHRVGAVDDRPAVGHPRIELFGSCRVEHLVARGGVGCGDRWISVSNRAQSRARLHWLPPSGTLRAYEAAANDQASHTHGCPPRLVPASCN